MARQQDHARPQQGARVRRRELAEGARVLGLRELCCTMGQPGRLPACTEVGTREVQRGVRGHQRH